MTAEEPSLTSRAELNEELQALLVRAHESGVDVKGGHECRNGAESPDWDVVITELKKDPQAE